MTMQIHTNPEEEGNEYVYEIMNTCIRYIYGIKGCYMSIRQQTVTLNSKEQQRMHESLHWMLVSELSTQVHQYKLEDRFKSINQTAMPQTDKTYVFK